MQERSRRSPSQIAGEIHEFPLLFSGDLYPLLSLTMFGIFSLLVLIYTVRASANDQFHALTIPIAPKKSQSPLN